VVATVQLNWLMNGWMMQVKMYSTDFHPFFYYYKKNLLKI